MTIIWTGADHTIVGVEARRGIFLRMGSRLFQFRGSEAGLGCLIIAAVGKGGLQHVLQRGGHDWLTEIGVAELDLLPRGKTDGAGQRQQLFLRFTFVIDLALLQLLQLNLGTQDVDCGRGAGVLAVLRFLRRACAVDTCAAAASMRDAPAFAWR